MDGVRRDSARDLIAELKPVNDSGPHQTCGAELIDGDGQRPRVAHMGVDDQQAVESATSDPPRKRDHHVDEQPRPESERARPGASVPVG